MDLRADLERETKDLPVFIPVETLFSLGYFTPSQFRHRRSPGRAPFPPTRRLGGRFVVARTELIDFLLAETYDKAL